MNTDTETSLKYSNEKMTYNYDDITTSEISPDLLSVSIPDFAIDSNVNNVVAVEKITTLKDFVDEALKASSKKITKNIRKNITSSTFKSEAKSINMKTKAWNSEEDDLFLKLLGVYGTDFTTIAETMMSKNRT
mmetsp:Transcript_7632/g.677  ORF Transcript_7632/g.677 Transcript_7632/m.677 type:complete len:133 (+) Transcript_7632:861-1259(+)